MNWEKHITLIASEERVIALYFLSFYKNVDAKVNKEGKGGWQTSDACDMIFLAGHSGLFPTFVGDGFTGGVLLHYEKGDRCVDVMFDRREHSSKKAVVSLCEAEASDTPFIPLNTIDAASHEQILSLIRGHLQ